MLGCVSFLLSIFAKPPIESFFEPSTLFPSSTLFYLSVIFFFFFFCWPIFIRAGITGFGSLYLIIFCFFYGKFSGFVYLVSMFRLDWSG